eukprot:1965105-Prymnesium_polylepis.1
MLPPGCDRCGTGCCDRSSPRCAPACDSCFAPDCGLTICGAGCCDDCREGVSCGPLMPELITAAFKSSRELVSCLCCASCCSRSARDSSAKCVAISADAVHSSRALDASRPCRVPACGEPLGPPSPFPASTPCLPTAWPRLVGLRSSGRQR